MMQNAEEQVLIKVIFEEEAYQFPDSEMQPSLGCLHDLIWFDRSVLAKLIAEKLDISKEYIRFIIHEQFGIRPRG